MVNETKLAYALGRNAFYDIELAIQFYKECLAEKAKSYIMDAFADGWVYEKQTELLMTEFILSQSLNCTNKS